MMQDLIEGVNGNVVQKAKCFSLLPVCLATRLKFGASMAQRGGSCFNEG